MKYKIEGKDCCTLASVTRDAMSFNNAGNGMNEQIFVYDNIISSSQ